MNTQRLLSLDIMRGITVAGMILVNNPGDWGHIYAPLRHAAWNGLTPTDLVFPFFMFMMGAAMNFSFSKYGGKLNAQAGWKILRRTVLLFLIGMALSWFSLSFSAYYQAEEATDWTGVLFPFERLRIMGVLQRLALTYGIGSLLVLTLPSKRGLWTLAGGILLVYYALLYVGNGFELSPDNLIATIDRQIIGASHMYTEWLPDGTPIAFDPEGLLSTLPGVAHVIIGYLAGGIFREKISVQDKMLRLAIEGTILLFVGYLLSYGCPINKSIWSPTFVLITCGLACLSLMLLTWIADIRKKQRWSVVFQAYGTNPLFIYIVAWILTSPFAYWGIQEVIYGFFLQVFQIPELASALYALCYIGLNGLLVYGLFKKRIFIKI